MCRCVPESQAQRPAWSSAWRSGDGLVVHPDAPRGGGGAGAFTAPGALCNGDAANRLPHPEAPAVSNLDPQRLDQAQRLDTKAKDRKPGPVISQASSEQAQGMTVQVLPDVNGVADIHGALTDFDRSGGGVSFVYSKDTGNVLSYNRTSWTLKIQTRYGSGTPNSDAAFGRGTTPEDIHNGDVTLGFHESCHRADLLAYFRTKAPPSFKGPPNVPESEARAAVQDYLDACDTYFAAAMTQSEQLTDEVGKAKSAPPPEP